MAPILHYGLPAMGICRSFPRKIVFAPTKYMGLGFKHLYTIQEIARIKDIIHHSFQHTTTGHLYVTSMELLLLELGVGTILHNIPFISVANLATNSLIKSTWKFLYDHQIHLMHNICLPMQRQEDVILMERFHKEQLSILDMTSLNRYRLFLRAYHLSDIVDGSGYYILDEAWMGRSTSYPARDTSWPKQAPPTRSDWHLW
jgi:hypothetical protein